MNMVLVKHCYPWKSKNKCFNRRGVMIKGLYADTYTLVHLHIFHHFLIYSRLHNLELMKFTASGSLIKNLSSVKSLKTLSIWPDTETQVNCNMFIILLSAKVFGLEHCC